MKVKKIHTPFDPPSDDGIDFTDAPSLCQSQFKDECDINLQIARLQRGDSTVLKQTGLYYDISNIPNTLQDVLELQILAKEIWTNPDNAEIAKRFAVPANLIDFLSNPDNREEAVKLGLIADKVKPAEVSGVKTPETSTVEPVPPTT